MGTGFSKKKKQAKLMQDKFMQMQEQMKNLEVSGSAANGLVSLKLNGDGDLIDLKIKPECVDPEDVEGLEDLIRMAFKEAQEKLKKESPMSDMPDISSLGDLSSMFNM